MKNEVELLDGVETFLETLPQKLEAKAYWTMSLLQRMGDGAQKAQRLREKFIQEGIDGQT